MKKTIIMLLTFTLLICCLTGCQSKTAPSADTTADQTLRSGLADYMAEIRSSSDTIRASLEKDDLTQTEMNEKSRELCDLWEDAMNRLLEDAKKILTEAELSKLNAEQTDWEAEMIAAVKAAGKEYEGGSIYALIVNSEKAKLTQERVYKLYERLK